MKQPTKKVLVIIAASLTLLITAVLAGGLIYINSLLDMMNRGEIVGDDTLTEDQVYEEEPTYDVPDSKEEIEDAQDQYDQVQDIVIQEEDHVDNILLIGSDRRNTNELGRSDAMMILSINKKTGNIHIVSLMRAMYVNIPRPSGDTWGMLNAAYSWGGTSLLIKTIENNFRIDIDNYVVVDFTSFTKAIDLVGGVEINLSNGEAVYINNRCDKKVYVGKQLLNGEQALHYSRIRKLDNDFVRTSRQRTVITALLNKALKSSVGTLTNLAEEILPSISTDLSNADIMNYLTLLPTFANGKIDQIMLPVENQSGTSFVGKIYVNGREMYKVDFAANIKALHELLAK